jgi:predicted dinucleotide-utilizing enzyme
MRPVVVLGLGLLIVTVAIAAEAAKPGPTATITPTPAVASSELTLLALPGASADGVSLDYLAVDRLGHRVWVPAGGTGNAVVIDTKTQEIRTVEKFATKEVERRGQKRMVGLSSATVGDGVVYVGNRADSSVCAVDGKTLERRDCVTLEGSPDGLAFVARTKEVWVTTPHDQAVVILDAPGMKISEVLVREGDRVVLDQTLARLTVGIVGLGSVGSIVAETIARMGLERFVLIDYDEVQPHNLDRLLGAAEIDIVISRSHVLQANWQALCLLHGNLLQIHQTDHRSGERWA